MTIIQFPYKKLQILFDPEARSAIERMRVRLGVASAADALKQALGLLEWALEKREQGYKVCAVKKGEPTVEVQVGPRP